MKANKFFCAFTFLFGIAAFAGNAPDTNVPFTLMRGSIVVVPVLVNGRGPYEFVLDTGCESSQIDLALATELQLHIVDRVVLFTPVGRTTMGRAVAEQMALGSAKVAMSELLVGRLDRLREVSPRIRGILGQNFLYHFNYLLDYKHSRIELEPEEVPGATQELRMPVTRQHGLTVLAGQTPEGETVRLLLDSGSSGLILFRENLHGFVPCHTQLCGAEMTTSNGSQRVNVGSVRRMEIGSASLHSLPAVVVVQQSDRNAGSLDGLLPTSLFGSVYFNNRESYVVVQPRGASR